MEFDEDSLFRNRVAYYISRIDILSLLIVGIIAIWLKSGLDLVQILLLQGLFGLFMMILEFPSGVLADVTKRKNVLVLAYINIALGITTYLFGNSFVHYVIAEGFYAIALASRSGADTALIYDSYACLGREEEGDDILSQGKLIMIGSAIIQMVLGGILASYSIRFTLILGIIGALIQGFSYLQAVEPDRIKIESSSQTMKLALRKLNDVKIIQLLLASLFGAMFLKTAFWDYLPRVEQIGLEDWTHGIILAGANFIAFVTSIIVRKHKKLQKNLNIIAALGTLGMILWNYASSLSIIIIAIALHQIARGSFGVALILHINNEARSEIRASLHSLISAIGFGIYFISSLIFSLLDISDKAVLTITSGASVITLILMLLSKFRHEPVPNQETIPVLAD